MRFLLVLFVGILWQTLSLAQDQGLTLPGRNGTQVAVAGIKHAETGGLLVQLEEEGPLQLVPWAHLDLEEIRRTHPLLARAWSRATNEREQTVLDLGSCKGLRLADTYAFDPETKFERLEKVEWIDNDYNDGDSFHCLHQGKRYVFRLYFVDAAETSMDYPDRVREQAKYFGLESSAMRALSDEARTAAAELLKSGPFTVFTQWTDARGQTRGGRSFAFLLLADGKLLSERLASKGLVRIYGMRTDTPDGRSADDWSRHLARLESSAKRQGLGGWKRE